MAPNAKSKLATSTSATILGLIVACLALATQLGCSFFDTPATATPPTKIPEITPVATLKTTATPHPIETWTPKPTDTSLPSATLAPKSTDTPRPTATATPTVTPTLGIGSTKISTADGAPMAFVPAGEFTMGHAGGGLKAEAPEHLVYLDSFWIDKLEVTNALYKKCVDAGKCSAPSDNKSQTRNSYYGNTQFDKYPVIYVSWNDAANFCAQAGKKLPTEAQWEKAARGTDKRIYPWGNAGNGSEVNGWKGSKGDTTAVGSYPSGASPYGAFDMAGNVREWTADWYHAEYYALSPSENPKGPSSGTQRVVRGGSWFDGTPGTSSIGVTSRDIALPDTRNHLIGFRCVE